MEVLPCGCVRHNEAICPAKGCPIHGDGPNSPAPPQPPPAASFRAPGGPSGGEGRGRAAEREAARVAGRKAKRREDGKTAGTRMLQAPGRYKLDLESGKSEPWKGKEEASE